MFTWAPGLLALVLVPVLFWAYRALLRGGAPSAETPPPLQLVETASGRAVGRRRHIPPLLYLAGITLLLLSLSRPTAPVSIPRLQGTVLLAFDVSTSMIAEDFEPNRMEAAKEAARRFIAAQPRTVQIGIVAFSDTAFVVQPPTNVRADLVAAVDRLTPQGGTSVSEGLFRSLSAIAGRPLLIDEEATPEELMETDIGYFGSAVILMLTDGEHTAQTDPLALAQLAANAGVRVYTVGIGSPTSTTIEVDGYRIATALNEPLLREIADTSAGEYVRAESSTQLSDIYSQIDLGLTTPGERIEVTSFLALGALALFGAGALLSLRWFGRAP
ncbi:MAG: VWA domain-containing protein [Dehalococcoidia bacterium]|nr:VWA domain-containing protein [Dehalococcoidia bacterium]